MPGLLLLRTSERLNEAGVSPGFWYRSTWQS